MAKTARPARKKTATPARKKNPAELKGNGAPVVLIQKTVVIGYDNSGFSKLLPIDFANSSEALALLREGKLNNFVAFEIEDVWVYGE